MDRRIVYFQIPSFEIALAQRHDPSLKKRPVAIAPSRNSRSCLLEVSRTAHEEGLRPGMPVELARRLCPDVQVLQSDASRVAVAHRNLQTIVAGFAPIWEPVQPGHMFLDLTGTHRLFGPAIDTAVRLEREILRHERLTGVLGVGTNKLVSRVAATVVQPPELCEVRPGLEPNFLSPVAVSELSFVLQCLPEIPLALLDDLNLLTLGAIARTPLSHLEVVFGASAGLLHRWAHGIDSSPVLPVLQQPNIERSVSVTPDEIDDKRLLRLLYDLLEQICRTLRRQGRVCRRLQLTIRHSDHIDGSAHYSVNPGTWWESDWWSHLRDLFFRCFQRRVRLRTMTLRVDRLEYPRDQWGRQLSLFEPEPSDAPVQEQRAQRLTRALDHLRERFGDDVIRRGHAGLAKRGG